MHVAEVKAIQAFIGKGNTGQGGDVKVFAEIPKRRVKYGVFRQVFRSAYEEMAVQYG